MAAQSCEFCGGSHFDDDGKCEECGNERRKPLVVKEVSKEHSGWYELEEKLLKDDAKPHEKPKELP